VRIGGAIADPTTYSTSALAALPQSTFTVTHGSRSDSDTGVSLEYLVNTAVPTLPTAKNALLRVTVAVDGPHWRGPVTLALGELDPSFGNHPAYLALTENGHALRAPELVVPGDTLPARTVPGVDSIDVAVQSPAPTTPPSPGAITVSDGGRSVVLTAAQLAVLPSETLQVSFEAGTASQSHTEVGPSLDAVLRAAHVPVIFDPWVAAVGDDGYVATVTPAEQWVAGKQLQLSLNEDGQALAEPRLVVDGDVKGGRYVSGVENLVVNGPSWPHHRRR
jgi:hypothetical protein